MTATTDNPIQTVYREGRLIRSRWSDTDMQGRELLCLLTALAGNPNARPESCDALGANSDRDRWLLYMLPWFDDAGSEAEWPRVIERCIALVPRWRAMTAAQSRHLDLFCRRVAVAETRTHCPDSEANTIAAIDKVLALLDRALAGDEPTSDEWSAAWAVQEAAWAVQAAAWAEQEAAWAVQAAAWAVQAAAWAVQAAAWAAAVWAVQAAAWAAAVWAVQAAAWAAAVEARAADRMIDAMLTEMERVLN